jgi:predicted DCC family thiol-disulfide oxidoreductase YuxK
MTRTPGRDTLTVCYNGACPVCRAEIDHYRTLTKPADQLIYRNVAAAPAEDLDPRLKGDTGFRRLHALTADGRLFAGIDAFIAVWERLPRYRWLARLARRGPVRRIAGFLYERAAAPLLFRLHQRRQRSAAATARS